MSAKSLDPSQIHVLTYAEFAQVWHSILPAENIHTISRKISLGSYIKFVRTLPKFDYIFDWHDNLRSAIAKRFIHGKSYTYKKYSFARRAYVKWRKCRDKLQKHTVQRYAESLFPAFGLNVPPMEELRPCLSNHPVATRHPSTGGELKIVIHPFASKFTKVWQYFPELAERLVQMGHDVVIVGKGDFPEIAGVARAEASSLEDLFSIMNSGSLVISTDSGPMHAAIGLNKPLLAIFGSTTRELGFYPDFKDCKIVERMDVVCRPCHVHGQDVCPRGDFQCMDISVEEVVGYLPYFSLTTKQSG
jgi:ADP-heptose:LPS heptosyltransferase